MHTPCPQGLSKNKACKLTHDRESIGTNHERSRGRRVSQKPARGLSPMLGLPDRELASPASTAPPGGGVVNLRRALALEFPQTADKSALAFGIPSLDAALG